MFAIMVRWAVSFPLIVSSLHHPSFGRGHLSCLHTSLLPESLSRAFSGGFRGLFSDSPGTLLPLWRWRVLSASFEHTWWLIFCWCNRIHESGLIIKTIGLSGNRYWESKMSKVRRPSLVRTYGASLCHRKQKDKGTWTEERKQSRTPTTVNTFNSLSSMPFTQSSPTGPYGSTLLPWDHTSAQALMGGS